MRDREVAIADLNLWVGLAAQLPYCFDDFGDSATVGRMVVAQAAAVCVEGELADTRDQVPVRNEFSALALRAEAQIFDLHQHRDGEAVINRRVFDVGRLHSGFRKCLGSAPGGARIGEIDLAAIGALRRFSGSDEAPKGTY